MKVDRIFFKNIRCFNNKKIYFSKKNNVITGLNGKGKTTILEGIWILTNGKSFKTNNIQNIVKDQEKPAEIKGVFIVNKEQEREIKITINKNKKKIFINNKTIKKRSDLLGKVQTVVLAPEDSEKITGPNKKRINYFNQVFSFSNKKYFKNIIEIEKITKQRTQAIKEKNQEIINIFTTQLFEKSKKIWEERQKNFLDFSKFLIKAEKKIKKNYSLRILYENKNLHIYENYINEVKKIEEKEKTYKRSLIGPNYDKISFFFNDKNARTEPSQGETKIASVLLKIGETLFIKEKTKKEPIVLLDDLYSFLDKNNYKTINSMMFFFEKNQTIISTTEKDEKTDFHEIKMESL